jgi:lysyl-tRNA synthetase class 2
MTDTTASPAPQDENQLIAERRTKLQALRQRQAAGGAVAFPNDFKPAHHADALHTAHGAKTAEALAEEKHLVRIAGRMVLKRVMGKASFATLQDGTGRMQVYVKGEEIGVEHYEEFKHWDLGDFVGAVGHVFKTKTGELSVHVTELRLLTKSLRPLPDKFHGVHDQEIKYRQRYIDLITDETARQRF